MRNVRPARRFRAMRSRRGMSLIEMVVAVLLISFVFIATARLYTAGQSQQLTARLFSQMQTDLRTSLRQMTRTIRHASAVVSSGTSSGVTTLVVTVPNSPSGGTTYSGNITFTYTSSTGTLTYQWASAASATTMETGLSGCTFNFYQSSVRSTGSTRTQVNSTPSSATEVQITLTATSNRKSVSETAYVTMRNSSWMGSL